MLSLLAALLAPAAWAQETTSDDVIVIYSTCSRDEVWNGGACVQVGEVEVWELCDAMGDDYCDGLFDFDGEPDGGGGGPGTGDDPEPDCGDCPEWQECQDAASDAYDECLVGIEDLAATYCASAIDAKDPDADPDDPDYVDTWVECYANEIDIMTGDCEEHAFYDRIACSQRNACDYECNP